VACRVVLACWETLSLVLCLRIIINPLTTTVAISTLRSQDCPILQPDDLDILASITEATCSPLNNIDNDGEILVKASEGKSSESLYYETLIKH